MGKNAVERHAELCREIQEHDRRYYVLDAPTLSDAEYDALFQELKRLEAAHPELVSPASPTQRVGAEPRAGVVKVERAVRMYSLDNAYSEGELAEFDRRVREGLPEGTPYHYVAEPKIDGASIELVYEGGVLVLGATRGDGAVGEDVTASVRTIRALPLTIAETRTFTLRGEVFIHGADLEAVNEERRARGEEVFANPRNAASGSLRLLDAKQVAERPLRIVLYDLVEPYFESHAEMLKALHGLGLPTHRLEERVKDLAGVLRYIERFDGTRAELAYDTDGVVVKLDELKLRQTLGFTARFPRWAVAYKYAAERAKTRVVAITADVGRTGALTPVADLEPVELSGTVVSRASLHNLDYVREKDVRVGDLVTIQKAGEIIPQVLEVDVNARLSPWAPSGPPGPPGLLGYGAVPSPAGAEPWVPPSECPVCGTPVVRMEGEAALRCPNGRCPGRLKAAVFHFTRRTAMDIDRLGRVLIGALVDEGLVTDLADLFALPERRDRLVDLERMGEKSADNVIAAIEKARVGRPFHRLVNALGIPLVGSVAAQPIAERYPSLDALLAADPSEVGTELGELHGIGPKIAESVADYLRDEGHRAMLERLLALGVTTEAPTPKTVIEGPLRGKSFCVTGTLSEPREAVWAHIEAAGGEVHKSVKKGTTYLVAGEDVGKTKLDAARKRGTEVITEAALRQMLGGS